MTEKQTPDRKLFAIFLIVLIDVLGLTIVLPLLPFYSEHFGATPFVVGTLVSSYAIAQFISGPILGRLNDRIGRKPVLMLSQMGTLLSFLLLAFAPSLLWIFVARIVDGLTAGNLSTAQAYIADVSAPQARAKALGKIGVAFGIGFFIGPALAAFLFRFGYQAPILAAAFLSFLSIVASAALLPNQKKAARPVVNKKASFLGDFVEVFKRPAMTSLMLQFFLFYLSFSSFQSGFALFAERRFTVNGVPLNTQQVGYAFSYFGFLGIIIQGFLIGRLVNRFGEKRLTQIGFLTSFIGYACLGLIHEPIWIMATGLFTSFGAGVLRPTLTSEISHQAQPHERGMVMGVNQSLQSIALIFAPLVSTAIIGHDLLAYWAWLPSVFSALGLLLIFVMRRRATH